MPEQIPLDQLVRGKWYVGRGRNGNVGKWDGQCFLVAAEKFDDYVVKQEPYYEANWGCFQPFALIDEGITTEPLGKVGWDKHYGRQVEFGTSESGRAAQINFRAELVGCWAGSFYYWDGSRTDEMICLNVDGCYEETLAASDSQRPPRIDRGTWRADAKEMLLEMCSSEPSAPGRARTWCILGFTGSTLLLRLLALANRNLPVLLYRIDTDLKARMGTSSPSAP